MESPKPAINIYRSEMMNSCLMCSLKLECEKLAQEKTEIQRQYIMVSDLNFDQFKHLIIW